MLEVRQKNDGMLHTLIINGHADHEVKGKDIVCAGVSALAMSLRNAMEYAEKEDMLDIYHAYGRDGYCEIKAKAKDEYKDMAVSLAFYQTGNTIKALSEEYPENISYEFLK